jgi:hypothetical protein
MLWFRNASTKVVHQSVWEGLGRIVKKSDVLIWKEEHVVLESNGADLSHPHDCNSYMGYFLCWNFFIRGQNELRVTNANRFELHLNGKGDKYLKQVIYISCL